MVLMVLENNNNNFFLSLFHTISNCGLYNIYTYIGIAGPRMIMLIPITLSSYKSNPVKPNWVPLSYQNVQTIQLK